MNSVKEDKNYEDDGMLKLNYTLALIYRFHGEDETSAEYCKSIESQLLEQYGNEHNKMLKFYDLFPFYNSEFKELEMEKE